MYGLIALFTLGIGALIVTGIHYHRTPRRGADAGRRFRRVVGGNLLLFGTAIATLLFIGAGEVMAAVEAAEPAGAISIGTGLAIIGVGIPTAFSTIAAGIAVGPIGAASLAVLAEKPEIFGRTLIYLGLAEGIAIYGLVMSILLLDRL